MRKVWGLLVAGLFLIGCSSQGVPPQVTGNHWGLTLSLPAGEGALVATVDYEPLDWVFVTSESLNDQALTQFRATSEGRVRAGAIAVGDWEGGNIARLVFERLREDAVMPVVTMEVSNTSRSRVVPAVTVPLVRLPGWSPPLVNGASVDVPVVDSGDGVVMPASASIPVVFEVPFDASFVANAFGSVLGFGASGRALSLADVVQVSAAVGGSAAFFTGAGLSAAERSYRLFHADLNGNGVVNAFDVILGLRKYVDACSGSQSPGVDDCGSLASELVVVPQVFDASAACVLDGGVRSCSALVVNAGNVPFGAAPVVGGFPSSLVAGSFGHVVQFGFPRLFVSSLSVGVAGVGSRSLGVNFPGVAGVSVFPSAAQVLPVGSSLGLTAVASVVGGGSSAVSWSSSDDSVVSVSSSGVVSGVAAGSAVVRASSVLDVGVFGEVSVVVPPLLVGSDYAAVSGSVGVGLSVAPSGVSGGFGVLSFGLVSGSLPGGLVLSASTGLISGVPLEAGSFSGVVRVLDSASPRQSRDLSFSFVISGVDRLVVSNYPVSGVFVGDDVSVSPVVSGGFGDLSFVLVSGSLPLGVSLGASSGVLSGVVSQVGSFAGVVQVSDEAGQSGAAPFLLVVSGVPGSVVASNYVSVSVAAGDVVSMPPVVSGGVSPLSFSLVSGSLPGGVLLDPVSGVIGGVPTDAGQFSGVVLVADAVGVSVAVSFVLNVSQVIPPLTALPYGSFEFVVGDEVLVVPRGVAGGLGSWSFELVDGALPDGVSLNAASGVLSGVASVAGSFSGSVRVSDEASNFVVVSFSVVVSEVVEPLVFVGYDAVSVVRGVEFSASPLGVSGGVAPLVFAVVSGSLPDGVSVNAVSGVVSGVPLVAGSFAAVVSVSDAAGSSVPVSLLVTVTSSAERLSVEPYALTSVAVGVSVSLSPGLVSGGDAPLVFSLASGSLPEGVSLNASSGVIAGVPSVPGSFGGSVLVEDASGQSAVVGFSLLVTPAVTPLVAGDYVSARVLLGESVNMPSVGVSGGVSPYSFEVAAGALPDGVSVNASSGLLFGVPSVVGDFSGAVLVRDALGQVAVAAFSLVVFADVPELVVLPYVGSSVLAGESFELTPVVVSGGSGGLVFSLVSGSLPEGVSLDASSGVIGGSTSALGSVAVAVSVVDSSGQRVVVSASFVVGELVDALVFGPYLPASGRVGELLAIPAGVVSGGVSPFSFALVSGSLPEGVSLSASSGALSGTPSAAGSFDGVVRVTDAVGSVAFSAFAFLVNSDVAPLVVLPYASASRLVGSSLSLAANVSSFGVLPLAFELVEGALPGGVSLDAVSGLISGVPSVVGSFSGAVRVSDAAGQSATATFLVTVSEDVTVLVVDPYPTVTRVLGQALSLESVNARGGVTPYVFSLSSGSFPAGVTVGSAGVISGVPSEVGLFSGLVRVEDAVGQVAFAPFFVSVVSDAEPIAWLPYSDATVLEGGSLSIPASLSGGEEPFEFSLAGGSLPAGVSLDAVSGLISGVPSVAGSFSGAVRVVDAVGQRSSASFRILVTPNVTPVSFGGYGFVSLSLDASVSLLPLSVSGGVSPYEFALASGSLPPGLVLGASGVISGAPVALGSWSGVIRVTDSVGQVASAAFAFVVNPVFDPLVASPYVNVVSVVGSSVSMSPVGVSGGYGDVSFALVSGSLPAGVSLSASSGVISGVPSVEGSFSGAVAVVDQVGSRVVVTFSIVVTPDVTPLVPEAYANASVVAGEVLSVSSSVSGGLTPYAFSLLSGDLPAGVSLDAVSGVISGVPSEAGAFLGSVRVVDALGQSVGVTFSIVVSSATSPLVGGAYAPVSTLVNEAVVITPSVVSGGLAPYSFALVSGSLPAGLVLDVDSGVVSGSATVLGSFAAVVSVSDSVGQSRSSAVAVSVVEPVVPLLVDAYAFESVVVGSELLVSPVIVSGGAGDLVFSLESGALPGGVSLDAASGALSGLTSTVGVFSGVVRVVDADGKVALASFRVTVRPAELVVGAYADSVVVEGTVFSVLPGSVSGGAEPLSFSLVGSLPAGVSLDAVSGEISGAASELGVFSGLVRVSDSFGLVASAAYLVDVRSSADELLLSPYPFSSALVGSSVSVSPVGLSGGKPSLVFELVSGALPGGVSLDAASGVLSGVPSVAGSFSGVVSVSDAVGQRVLVTFSFVVSEVVPELVGVSYEAETLVEGQVAGVAGPSVSGGLSPYSFVLSSGALPGGVSLSASSGALSGAPSVTGVFSGVITVSDAAGQSVPLSFAFTVVPDVEPLLVLPYGSVSQVSGSVLSLSASVEGGRAPFVFSRLSGSFPSGVSLSESSGALSGSLSGTGSFSGVIGVVDAVGQSATASFSIVVTPDVTPVVMSDYASEEFLDGSLVSFSAVGVSGGVPPYSFEVMSGSLPSGLVLGAGDGSISGTAGEVGSFAGVVRVTDSVGQSAVGSFSLVVLSSADPLVVLPYSPASALVGGSVSVSPGSVSGGSGGLSFAVVGGSLPAGVSLNASTGLISGSPSVAGSFVGAVRVVDSVGQRVVVTFSIMVSAVVPELVMLNYAPSTVLADVVFSASPVGLSGGVTPYSFSVVSGALPSGLVLGAGGVISGTPTEEGTFAAVIVVADASGQSVPVSFGVTVLPNVSVLTVSPYASTSVVVGDAVSLAANVSGGRAPYSFSLVSGSLPAGLSLNASSGAITGTASVVGVSSGAVRVTDALGAASTLGFVIEVQPTVISVSNYVSLERNVESNPGFVTIAAPVVSGGVAPYSYTLINRTDASFPNVDWVLNSNGSLSGTLSVVGSWVGSVLVRDSSGQSAVANYSIAGTKTSSFVASDYPRSSFSVNAPVSLSPSTLSGAVGAISSTLASGTLPPGLTLGSGASAHFLSGTVSAAGAYSGVVRFTDSIGQVALSSFSIEVIVPLVASNYATRSVTLNDSVSMSPVGVSGGSGGLTYALVSGSLPSGVSLNTSTGVISGTASVTGVFGGVVSVTDAAGTAVRVSFALSVLPPEIFVLPYGSAVGEVNFSLSVSPGTVSDAVAPLSFALSSGSLPAGVSVNASTGVISGTPTQSGAFSGFVRVTDSRGSAAQMRFSFSVSTTNAALSFADYGTINTSPGVTLRRGASISGGLQPYSFSISSGSLQTGLLVDSSSGMITGRTYDTGNKTATVLVTDAVGRSASASVTVSSVVDLSRSIAVNQATGGGRAMLSIPADAAVGDLFIVFFGSYGGRSYSTPVGCTSQVGWTITAGTTSTGARFRVFSCTVDESAIGLGVYDFGYDAENWAVVTYLLRGGVGAGGYCEIVVGSGTSTSTISSYEAPSITAYQGFSFNVYVTRSNSTFTLGAGTAGRVLHQVQNDGVGLDTGTTTTVSVATAYVRRTGTGSTGTQTVSFSPSSSRTVGISGYCDTGW